MMYVMYILMLCMRMKICKNCISPTEKYNDITCALIVNYKTDDPISIVSLGDICYSIFYFKDHQFIYKVNIYLI